MLDSVLVVVVDSWLLSNRNIILLSADWLDVLTNKN